MKSCNTQEHQDPEQSDGNGDEPPKKTKKHKRCRKEMADTVEDLVPAESTKKKTQVTETAEVARPSTNKKKNKRKMPASFLEDLAADQDAL